MILIVTNQRDYTADFLILELRRRGIDFIRFNTEDFPQRVRIAWGPQNAGTCGHFIFPKRRVDFREIQSIWYRRPVAPVPSPILNESSASEFVISESQAALEGVWRSLDSFWVSNPDNLRRAELKLYQITLAAKLGFSVPPTVVTNNPEEARAFYRAHAGNVVYKTLRQGRLRSVDGLTLIYTNPVGSQEAERLDDVAYAPTLLQGYVEKRVEIRVTVIGQQVFPVAIHSQEHPEARHDWRRVDAWQLRNELCALPDEVEERCRKLVEIMGLAFGAIDLIETPEGRHVFLEINPNGQWAWIQQLRPEIPLRETLADLLVGGHV
jgi:glutathione synthase/RimK-type ligase-like ATP-grasp enzyme